MEKYLSEIFERLKAHQKEEVSEICPRCGEPKMRPIPAHNGLSRHVDVCVCPGCGMDEALTEYLKHPRLLTSWHIVKEEMKGKTFLDFLRGCGEFECELIIGGADMPATFVWDADSNITPFGEQYYAALMDAPYKLLDNGNIEILCDDYILGKHFVLALAGYIGDGDWERLFGKANQTI